MVLKDAKGILDELQAYKGAGVAIREVRRADVYLQLARAAVDIAAVDVLFLLCLCEQHCLVTSILEPQKSTDY